MTYDALDDFAGPGGWDEGARMVGLCTIGVEWDESACATAEAAGHARICADVAGHRLDSLIGIRGYIASPPCTDFSTAGKGEGESGKSGALVRLPLRRSLELRPEWIAWEQVATVLPIWEECAVTLRANGYDVWTGILDASRYGVPQSRRRAVLMASRTRRVSAPAATHGSQDDLFGGLKPVRTLADVLGIGPGWLYDSGQNSVLGGGVIERYVRACDRPAGTITSKAAGQWVLTKGTQRRKISRAEAALIQGFPADYPWRGSPSEQSQQIGNAIPPLLAAHVLSALTGRALESEVAA